jgi:hypothetical protein
MSVGRTLFTSKFRRFAILVGILLLACAFYRLDPYVPVEPTPVTSLWIEDPVPTPATPAPPQSGNGNYPRPAQMPWRIRIFAPSVRRQRDRN